MRQNEQIACLINKLENNLFKASNKHSSGQQFDKRSNCNEDLDDKRIPKKDMLLGWMSIEQILSYKCK